MIRIAEYKIIKYCPVCKKRFVVNKGESKIRYCEECQKRYEKQKNNEEKKK